MLRGAERAAFDKLTKESLWARLPRECAGLKTPPWTALAARMTLILQASLRNRADVGTFAVGGGEGEVEGLSGWCVSVASGEMPVTRNNFSEPVGALGIVRDRSTKERTRIHVHAALNVSENRPSP